jgi:integrase
MVMKLDARTVQRLRLPDGKADHFYWDSELKGFGLRIRSGDTAQAVYVARYQHAGKTKRFRIGPTDLFTPAKAREEARKILAEAALGRDPQAIKAESRKPKAARHALGVVVRDYLARRRGELRRNSFDSVQRYLAGGYFQKLHALDVDDIQRRDVAEAVGAIEEEHGRVAAARARTTLHAFYQWAMSEGRAESNPVAGTRTPAKSPPRDRVLTGEELARIWNASDPTTEYGQVIRLLILTGCRRAEVGGMRWSEIDLERGLWTLPAARAKNARAHILPLPETALEILRAIPRQGGREHVFGVHSPKGFTSWDLKEGFDERCGIADWVVHDLRRSVATGMADIGIQPHIVEAVLNHQGGHKGGVAGIYNRSLYTRDVRAALAAWESHLRGLVGGERRVIVFPGDRSPTAEITSCDSRARTR